MTSLGFDERQRRLVTGAHDGTVRVWNFSNGQCLQQLKNDGQSEVSCITFIVEAQNKFIVAGGWNRKVHVWRDEASSSSAAVEPVPFVEPLALTDFPFATLARALDAEPRAPTPGRAAPEPAPLPLPQPRRGGPIFSRETSRR